MEISRSVGSAKKAVPFLALICLAVISLGTNPASAGRPRGLPAADMQTGPGPLPEAGTPAAQAGSVGYKTPTATSPMTASPASTSTQALTAPSRTMSATAPPDRTLMVFHSLGKQDGWVRESSETSGMGGSINATREVFLLGDDALNRQFRTILSFDTSKLPRSARIVSARLEIEGTGLVGTDPFKTHGNIVVDIRMGSFSHNRALQISDFEAPASKRSSFFLRKSPYDNTYYWFVMEEDLIYINRKGITQFRLRFRLDDNNDLGADYLKFASGDFAETHQQPRLIIDY